jgi:hypothetical protein
MQVLLPSHEAPSPHPSPRRGEGDELSFSPSSEGRPGFFPLAPIGERVPERRVRGRITRNRTTAPELCARSQSSPTCHRPSLAPQWSRGGMARNASGTWDWSTSGFTSASRVIGRSRDRPAFPRPDRPGYDRPVGQARRPNPLPHLPEIPVVPITQPTRCNFR